eukprot:scaffold10154_cov63-Cyclotella_meneghiniana.AAC.22
MEMRTPCMLLFPKNLQESVCILAHHLMQKGEPMRKRAAAAEHPLLTRDRTNVHDFGSGQALQSDACGDVADTVPRGSIPSVLAPCQRLRELRVKQAKHP